MAWPAVKIGLTQEQFRAYVETVQWVGWRPRYIMWHNTAAPSLAQWIKAAKEDVAKGLGRVPGISRIRSLEDYFKNQQGWSGGPHLFVANDLIWVFNPLNAKGVHSPTFNVDTIGIEMVGDFDKEDDDTGEGLKVRRNTVFATTILCEALGFHPVDGQIDHKTKVKSGTIFIHKQDPATTHDCPGKDVAQDKAQMIEEVQALMGGGEHNPIEITAVISGPVPSPSGGGVILCSLYEVLTTTPDLNLRKGPGVANESKGALPQGIKLQVLGTATGWLRVKTPAGYEGWVSERYTQRSK